MAQPRERESEREIGRDACVSCPEQSTREDREGGGGEEAEEERNTKIRKKKTDRDQEPRRLKGLLGRRIFYSESSAQQRIAAAVADLQSSLT